MGVTHVDSGLGGLSSVPYHTQLSNSTHYQMNPLLFPVMFLGCKLFCKELARILTPLNEYFAWLGFGLVQVHSFPPVCVPGLPS